MRWALSRKMKLLLCKCVFPQFDRNEQIHNTPAVLKQRATSKVTSYHHQSELKFTCAFSCAKESSG